MSVPESQRSWFAFAWLSGWSWLERAIVGLLAFAAVGALIIGGRPGSWVAGVFALLTFAAINAILYRHGGWHLLGPHFYYDVVRLARRGRSTFLRVAYIIAMFLGLAFVYETSQTANVNDFARVAESFAVMLFRVQNLAILVLTPAYLGSALTEEKERRTLELLFTTQLNNTEIVLGKLFSRTIHLVGFVLAGFPVLSLIQFWGGIDMLLIVGNLANTLLNILSIGSLCLFFSALAKTVAGAVMTSYAIVLPIGFCCMVSLRGFPFVLQDARSGGTENITVQDLGALAIAHLVASVMCLSLAVVALREQEPFSPLPVQPPRLREADVAPSETGSLQTGVQTSPVLKSRPAALAEPPRPPPRREDPLDEFSIPYTLPPVPDDALVWKERYVGGPPLVASPIMIVPAIPFLATGVMVMIVFLVHGLLSTPEDYRRAVEIWSVVLRFFYYVFLGAYLLGVAYRATSTVARERQQQTLDPLLLLPIDRRDILWAKVVGAVWRGWPWLVLLAGDIVIGTMIGGYHPVSAVLLCLAPIPLIVFFAALGLLISVSSGSVLRANLVMVVIVVLFISCTAGNIVTRGPLAYLETLAFSTLSDIHGDPLERGRHILLTFGVMGLYVLAAFFLWKIALLQFENRSRQPEG